MNRRIGSDYMNLNIIWKPPFSWLEIGNNSFDWKLICIHFNNSGLRGFYFGQPAKGPDPNKIENGHIENGLQSSVRHIW